MFYVIREREIEKVFSDISLQSFVCWTLYGVRENGLLENFYFFLCDEDDFVTLLWSVTQFIV